MATAHDETLRTWDQEHALTAKVLRAAPPGKTGLRPHEKSKSLGELCWHLAEAERFFATRCLGIEVPGENPVPKENPPATPAAMADAFDRSHAALRAACAAKPAAWFGEVIDFFATRMSRQAILDLMVRHEVHHRGQLTVYLRLAGAKVPSTYGGSADEPA
jgi:uncharacterized damage-inducible protein DinB